MDIEHKLIHSNLQYLPTPRVLPTTLFISFKYNIIMNIIIYHMRTFSFHSIKGIFSISKHSQFLSIYSTSLTQLRTSGILASNFSCYCELIMRGEVLCILNIYGIIRFNFYTKKSKEMQYLKQINYMETIRQLQEQHENKE